MYSIVLSMPTNCVSKAGLVLCTESTKWNTCILLQVEHTHITAGVCSTIRERGCVWSLPVFIRGVERCSITALDNHSHPHLLF